MNWTALREGKRECVWQEAVHCTHGTHSLALRRSYRLSERTQAIALYADHGTHEQFHSEFKSDMDLARLLRKGRALLCAALRCSVTIEPLLCSRNPACQPT